MGVPVRNPTDRQSPVGGTVDATRRILALPSEACRASALHGLGHWHTFAAERTEPIVRAFLAKETMSDPLRAYAKAAADGNVP